MAAGSVIAREVPPTVWEQWMFEATGKPKAQRQAEFNAVWRRWEVLLAANKVRRSPGDVRYEKEEVAQAV